MKKHSSEIDVNEFRTIMFLPLIYEGKEAINSIAEKIKAPWGEVKDLREHIDKNIGDSYAEFAYFHDFVADFLYSKEGNNDLRLFKNDTIKQVQLDASTTLGVERLSFYLFETGVAFLVCEVRGINTELKCVLDINEKIRRVYKPDLRDDTVYSDLNFGTKPEPIDFKQDFISKGKIPLMKAWQDLLPFTMDDWRHTADDRMPIMSFINVAEGGYKQIKKGDWYRLAFVDSAGEGYPSSEAFLKNLPNTHFYDRFHDEKFKTRFCISGYSFSLIGEKTPDFLVNNFRRHYFQMVLLANFEQQSLLRFSTRITDAVKNNNLREDMSAIQSDFLTFTHRFRFTGITNQLQGIELNALIRKHMGLDALYNDVKEEIASSNTYLSSEATIGLTYFAAIAAIASISIALASMGLLFGDSALKILFNVSDDHPVILGRFSLILLCFTVVTGIIFQFISSHKTSYFLKLQSAILNSFILFLTAAVFLGILQFSLCNGGACKINDIQKVEIMKNNDK